MRTEMESNGELSGCFSVLEERIESLDLRTAPNA